MVLLRPLSVVLLSFAIVGRVSGQSTWYVDDDAAPGGDGTSWLTAFRDLQDALTTSHANDEIRVAAGFYRPDRGNGFVAGDREAYFLLDSALVLDGGYRGVAGGGNPDDRDPVLFETILSGDLLGDDFENPFQQQVDDNSYTVVVKVTIAPRTLTGFVLQSGASVPGLPGHRKYGGAMDCKGVTTIRQCVFRYNRAQWGGALYSAFGASLVIEDCTFHDNSSTEYGGSVYAEQVADLRILHTDFLRSGRPAQPPTGGALYVWDCSNFLLDGCTFVRGRSSNAGAAVLRLSAGSIHNSVFDSNSSLGSQGALYLRDGTYHVEACRFVDNLSVNSGGAIEASQSTVVVADCEFVGNRSSSSGGAIFAESIAVRDCRFIANTAGLSGGAVWINGGEVTDSDFLSNDAMFGGALSNHPQSGVTAIISRSRFHCNYADSSGGGIMISADRGATTRVEECEFQGNSAQFGGGIAPLGNSATAIVEDCRLIGNDARSLGGGLYASNMELTATGSIFAHNKADHGLEEGGGGAIFLSQASANITRCTIVYNEVILGGGAGIHIENTNGAPVDLSTCVLWENFSLDGHYQTQQLLNTGGVLSVDYCCIRGLDGTLGGTGNIWNDPRFWMAAQHDYHLRIFSPCIDAGDPNLPPDSDGTTADMGALEYDPTHAFVPGAWIPRVHCR